MYVHGCMLYCTVVCGVEVSVLADVQNRHMIMYLIQCTTSSPLDWSIHVYLISNNVSFNDLLFSGLVRE